MIALPAAPPSEPTSPLLFLVFVRSSSGGGPFRDACLTSLDGVTRIAGDLIIRRRAWANEIERCYFPTVRTAHRDQLFRR